MSKCAKVICTYFGERRTHVYNNPKDMMSFFLKMMKNEASIDMGIETDVILVNNDCGNPTINEGVNRFNNNKTKNGKVIVEQRENIGGSFGAYFDMFKKYSSEYDFFFFCEDDHIIFKEGYMKDFVDFINSDEKVGYVALAPVTLAGLKELPVHSGGGIGLTSTKNFNMIYGEQSEYNFRKEMSHNQPYHFLQNYESRFNANFILHGGFEIKNHPKYSCIPNNYKNFEYNYINYLNEESLQKEFIYNVGE